MIDRNSVISLAAGLYGMETQGLSALCDAVCLETEPLLRNGADPGDARILMLAAAVLRHRYLIREAGGNEGVTSFKAGDVGVSFSSGAALKDSLAEIERLKTAAAPLLRDDSFYFGQVKYHSH